MTARPVARSGASRLAQLYEISKLLIASGGRRDTIDVALTLVAGTLPLESAILIEDRPEQRADMIVWPANDSDPSRLLAAKARATDAFAYFVGRRSSAPLDVW